MKVEELMQHIEDGHKVFVSANGRKRTVINAGWAWIEYTNASTPTIVTATFTEDFAKWASRPKAIGSTE